jgi:predicted transposase/invertase (TIGR01784 family)
MLSKLEKWLYFLKYEGTEDEFMKILIRDDEEIAQAHKEYERFTADDEIRELYEQRMKWQLDYNTDLEIAAQKGMEKGMEKGKLEAAGNMLIEGIPLQTVLKVTGLTEDALRKEGIVP